MIHADMALALRLERAAMAIEAGYALAHATIEPGADIEVAPIADGAAIYAGPDSPMSQATGLGLAGPVPGSDLDALESFYRRRGATARVVVCPLADPSLVASLGDRGFRLAEFEQTLVRALSPHSGRAPSEVVVRIAGPDDADTYIDAVGPNFLGGEPVAGLMRQMMLAFFHTKHGVGFLASLDGNAVGGGALLLHDGVAMLAGAGTLPEYRCRGVHAALFAARLEYAAREGCDLAVVGAQPGSGSQKNAERNGFRLAYTKAVLTKPAG